MYMCTTGGVSIEANVVKLESWMAEGGEGEDGEREMLSRIMVSSPSPKQAKTPPAQGYSIMGTSNQ